MLVRPVSSAPPADASAAPSRAHPEVEGKAPGEARPERSECFPRKDRLLRRSEFLRVQQQGRRVHTAHFIVLLLRAPAPLREREARLGVTVGKRIGGAVQRNRVKRLVRNVFRKNRALFPQGCDVVLVARPGADSLDYGLVLDELVRAQAAIERVRRQWSAAPEPNEP